MRSSLELAGTLFAGILLGAYLAITFKAPSRTTTKQIPRTTGDSLKARIPVLKRICEATGQPGVSIGVIHGETFFTHSIGKRDVENDLEPDADTLYCIGSCTKAFTAAALGILVDRYPKNVSWDMPLKKMFPDLTCEADPVVADRATLRDILSHRTGLAAMDTLWQGIHNEINVDKNAAAQAFNALLPTSDFRAKFVYNNILYSLAGNIIENVLNAQKSVVKGWGEFVTREILTPLGMNRTVTSTKALSSMDNVAVPYITLPNKKPFRINQPAVSDSTLIGSAAAIRSSVRDMLKWGKALLEANDCETRDMNSSSPLRQIMAAFGAMSIVRSSSLADEEYGFGWHHNRLPAHLGSWSINRAFDEDAELVGTSSSDSETSHLVFSHGGMIAGFTTSFYLFPNTKSVIVVLANSNALGDATDWIARDLIQTLFKFHPQINYVEKAEKTANESVRWFEEDLYGEWKKRKGELEPGEINTTEYKGSYQLSTYPYNFSIYDSPHRKDQLKIRFNNKVNQTHDLEYYDKDVWSFMPHTYDEYLTTGYLAWGDYKDFLVKFNRNDNDTITNATWTAEGKPLDFERQGVENHNG